jgi:hypothetical protein
MFFVTTLGFTTSPERKTKRSVDGEALPELHYNTGKVTYRPIAGVHQSTCPIKKDII